jgi:DNA-directed RNA polymerase alpha subunit
MKAKQVSKLVHKKAKIVAHAKQSKKLVPVRHKKPAKHIQKEKTIAKTKKTETPERKAQKKESREDITYVELTVKCTECGKEVKIVTLEGSDTSEYLCQKCSTGDFLEEDDEA